MEYNFDTMKGFYKNKGYTLIDYTAKIKCLDDVGFIQTKMKKQHKGKYQYDKTIILIRFEELCKKIKNLTAVLMLNEICPDAVHLYHTKNALLFETHKAPNELVMEQFVNRKDVYTCEVCCEEKAVGAMMPCYKCVYPCCKECFMKRARMTLDAGEIDGRCFGCRAELVCAVAYIKKV